MMKQIAPSILSANLWNLGEEVQEMVDLGANAIHIDVMDQHFVPNLGFSAQVVSDLRQQLVNTELDVHLMCEQPETMLQPFIDAGADVVTIHTESTPHLHRAIQMIKDQGVRAGIALNPGTPVTMLQEVLPLVDRVLVMTVNPGFGGQAFISSMIDKIKTLTLLREHTSASFDIEVDGGINEVTGAICAAVGAEVFVAGSYLFGADDRSAAMQALRQAIEKES